MTKPASLISHDKFVINLAVIKEMFEVSIVSAASSAAYVFFCLFFTEHRYTMALNHDVAICMVNMLMSLRLALGFHPHVDKPAFVSEYVWL